MEDEKWMRRALHLAERGIGQVNPNPLVGAVIVRDGRTLGEGWHERYGGPHAERNALGHCAGSPEGSDALCQPLEPCCHTGRNPPCTDAILGAESAGSSSAPRPESAGEDGRGISLLVEKGIEVVIGILKEESDAINAPFFHYIRTGTPYVVLKYAMTRWKNRLLTVRFPLDYRGGGAERVHQDRGYAAVMVGIGTVLATILCSPAGLRAGAAPCGLSATAV